MVINISIPVHYIKHKLKKMQTSSVVQALSTFNYCNNVNTWKRGTQWYKWPRGRWPWVMNLRPFSTDLLVLLVSLGSVILEVKYLEVMDTDSWLNTWGVLIDPIKKIGVYTILFRIVDVFLEVFVIFVLISQVDRCVTVRQYIGSQ